MTVFVLFDKVLEYIDALQRNYTSYRFLGIYSNLSDAEEEGKKSKWETFIIQEKMK